MKKVSTILLMALLLSSMVFAAGTKEAASTGPQVLKVMLSEEPSSEDALLIP